MRRVRLAEKKVDNVKESIDAIGVVLTNRDERDGDAACEAYGVLNIEILSKVRSEGVMLIVDGIRTASMPASFAPCGFEPSSRVCVAKVAVLISGRNSFRKVCR